MEQWYIPITIVPAIGLLILSTSHLLVGLSAEIKGLLEDEKVLATLMQRKLRQLKLLNTALVFLYISVGFLVIAGLVSGLREAGAIDVGITIYLMFSGIICLLMALVGLIVYSIKAVKLRQDQFNNKC